MTTHDELVAAGRSVDGLRCDETFEAVMGVLTGQFRRVEPQRSAREFVDGLLAPLERKTCWQVAEHAGHARPERMQRLLRQAVWDADAVRDDVRGLAVEHLEHEHAVLVFDETGFLKKGVCSAGVQRQYSGTAGRIENCQVGVFATYAGPAGHTLIDRELYLPKQSWCADDQRRDTAGVPDDRVFATKPELAVTMLERAYRADLPFRWMTADEVYGQSPHLRQWLHDHEIGYVLAVACDHRLTVGADGTQATVADIAAELPSSAWHTHSAGHGAKGPRDYDWAWIAMPGHPGQSMLIRRNCTTSEHAYYRCFTPRPVALAELVRVAGTRWRVEDSFQNGKSLVGLDQYQVRRWHAWYRFITLAMLALAYLAILGSTGPRPRTGQRHPMALIPLSLAEIRRILHALTLPPEQRQHALAWSTWRQHHQTQAHHAHYQRRQHELSLEY